MGGSFLNLLRRCFRKQTKKKETSQVKHEKLPLIANKQLEEQNSKIVLNEILEFKFMEVSSEREKNFLVDSKVNDDDDKNFNILLTSDLIDLSFASEDAVVPISLVADDIPSQSTAQQHKLNKNDGQLLEHGAMTNKESLLDQDYLFSDDVSKYSSDPSLSKYYEISNSKDMNLNEEIDECYDEGLMLSKKSIASNFFYDKDLESIIVIDNGSCFCRAGFSNNTKPKTIFSSVVGKPKYPNVMNMSKEAYVGDDAQKNRGILNLHYPIKNDKEDTVIVWNDLEMIWHYAFQKLNAFSEEHPVILTEQPLSSYKFREKMNEILFEIFSIPAVCIVNQAVASLFAYGKSTGVVLDSGNGVTHVVPVYKGKALSESTSCLNLAGHSVTEYLGRLLLEGGHQFRSSAELEVLRDIKEKHSFFAVDFDNEISKNQPVCDFYTLPDGRSIKLGNERFKCVEAMFKPYLMGLNEVGVHDAVYRTIKHIKKQYNEVYTNDIDLYLSGGTTLCKGFSIRLQSEINNLVPSTMKINVIGGKQNAANLAWTGASLIAKSDDFRGNLVTKKLYNEYGPSIYHRKFSL